MTLDTITDDVDRWTERLLADGYCVIPGLLTETAAALDRDLAEDFACTPFCAGGFYGARTKRFGRLLARSGHAEALVRHPLVIGIVERVLSPWCDTVQLNLTQAIALHPGALPQLPHRDQDMWRGQLGEIEYLVNVMWPLTPYTRDNGATLVWPGSHGPRALEPEIPTGECPIEMAPGSALLFLGSTLHGAGGNRTRSVRRELDLLGGVDQEIESLAALVREGPSPLLRRALAAFHRRRERIVAEIVAALVSTKCRRP